MSSVADSYVPEAYQGGKNQPEPVTEEFLTCRLCNDGFRVRPKILVCGHSFCLPCLDAYTCGGRKRSICCPTCGRPMCMPETGVRGLQDNLFVDTQIDRLLRRDNNANRRENSMYNLPVYHRDPFTLRASFCLASGNPRCWSKLLEHASNCWSPLLVSVFKTKSFYKKWIQHNNSKMWMKMAMYTKTLVNRQWKHSFRNNRKLTRRVDGSRH